MNKIQTLTITHSPIVAQWSSICFLWFEFPRIFIGLVVLHWKCNKRECDIHTHEYISNVYRRIDRIVGNVNENHIPLLKKLWIQVVSVFLCPSVRWMHRFHHQTKIVLHIVWILWMKRASSSCDHWIDKKNDTYSEDGSTVRVGIPGFFVNLQRTFWCD